MNQSSVSLMDRCLNGWSKKVLRYPWLFVIITIMLCGISLYYTLNHLGVNTNTAEMLSPDLPFQQHRQRIEAAFPHDTTTIIFVVNASTPEETTQAAHQLANELHAQTHHFDSVYIPTENDFFNQQALLYLETHELESLVNKLSNAQPFIGHLSQNYHLQGLFNLIHKALNQPQDLPMDLTPLLKAIDQAFDNQNRQQPYHLSWQTLLSPPELISENRRILVIARPKMNFNALFPVELALTSARQQIKKMMDVTPGLRIRMTGEVALEHEELESVANGSMWAGVLSFFLVCAALWFGLRSIKLLLATLVTLICGLILTAGFAAVAIGHLNLISIAFAVLYIGLGVDYAIHLCLRYRECRAYGMDNTDAIKESLQSVGFSLSLCALTTSVGFFVFVPTDYVGVSELGLISGAGMFIGLGVSLTLLPALLTLLSLKSVKPLAASSLPLWLLNVPFHFAKPIKIIAILLGIIAIGVLTQVRFDSNSIHLRDPETESVSTIKELLQSKTDSPYALSALSADLDTAKQLAQRLEALSVVDHTLLLTDLVAKHQPEKLALIEELAFILGSSLNQFKKTPDDPINTKAAVIKFLEQLTEVLKQQPLHSSAHSLQILQQSIHSFIIQADQRDSNQYTLLENNILGLLPHTMARLQHNLRATTYTLDDLPRYLSQRWLSDNGLYRILIMPAHDQNILENQVNFVRDVQTIDPSVTGLSVADQASGHAVVTAFIQAFSAALIAIFLLLWLLLKHIKNTLLVILPLLLATLLTAACNVLLSNPFNFANVIALPLLMGMGVDSGIHIMHRLNADLGHHQNLLATSTARGVFFSSVTTLCSFSSLAFTTHVGTSSMGLLLAIGIFFTLVCTLIVLPAFSGKTV